MHRTEETDHGVRHFIQTAIKHPAKWLWPTFLLGGLSFGYALIYQPDWQASQALTVREEATESSQWSGHFNEAEELKHAQETILELAKSPSVLTVALTAVGPPATCRQLQEWPSAEDVARASSKTKVVSPNGAEFGTTRMFYLRVSDPDPQRAIQLATAVCDESERRFKKLRAKEFQDAITELANTVRLAEQELDKQTAKLQEMETSVGSDLAELRMLSESFAGGSNLQTTLAEVRQELRQAENTYQSNEQLLNLLTAAQEDPSNLVATPNRLLEAQPALRRLKDGLTDAQLSSSQLLGTMSQDHPRVKAALVAESEIRGHLHRELAVAVRGLRAEQALVETHVRTLSQKVDDLQQRMQRLATMRAAYGNQLVEARQQTESLTRAQQELNAARASLAAGEVTSLVTRIDTPQTGPYPQGPQRGVIAAAGLVGGLLCGLGILVLSTPPVSHPAPVTEISHAAASQETPARPTATAGSVTQSPALITPAPITPAPLTPAPTAPTPVARTPMPAQRGMTLKEALVRCRDSENSWN